MKKEISLVIFWIVVMTILISLVGFAGHNDLAGVVNAKGRIAGIWYGIVHGFLFIIALVVSLFNKTVNIYELHNTGIGYNVGFVIGTLLWFISSKIFR